MRKDLEQALRQFPPDCVYHRRKRGYWWHSFFRSQLYARSADQMPGNGFYLWLLLRWCHYNGVFIHPAVCIQKSKTKYRDLAFFVDRPVAQYCPVISVPECLLIGFQGIENCNNPLLDASRIEQFNKANRGEEENDSDICDFFFASLGIVTSDLLSALHSTHSDKRTSFAKSLSKTSTIHNAPYFTDDIVFGKDDTSLADVLLQMIKNYIQAGPLAGKVERSELQWAVSISLSHSTPLIIGSRRSIGIVPFVHLFPHGGDKTNSVLVARSLKEHSACCFVRYFKEQFGIDFTGTPQRIYVTPVTALIAGDNIHLQAMAPVCSKENESADMWKLSCGSAPDSFISSTYLAFLQAETAKAIQMKGQPAR